VIFWGSWRSALRRGEARGRVFLRSTWAAGEMLCLGRPRHAPDEGWLILPRLDGIGDFWLWLPLVATLKKAFPDRKIHLLANSLWADLAHSTGLFDKITPLVPQKLLRSPTYRRQTWALLKKEPPGLLLNTTLRRRIAVEDSLAWFYPASARQSIAGHPEALEPPSLRHYLEARLYERVWPPPEKATHEWHLYSHIAQILKIAPPDFGVYARLLTQSWPEVENPFPAYIVAMPGASVPYKMVPLAVFGDLLREIARKLGLPIVFLGSKKDRPYVQELRKFLPPHRVEDLTGSLALPESIAVLRQAWGVIGVDTGLTHIAATWGSPTLVLMGGGHWGRFFPYPESFPYQPFILHRPMSCYGCGWFCQYTLSQKAPYPCIATLEQAPMEPFYRWLQAVSARK
jgi:ADP-heptose:LPS heptosyltransferase